MGVRNFGEVIRERRRRLNLTQQQVARRIGVSTPFVGHLESCKRRPSHHTVQLLADALGLDRGELFVTANPEAVELLRWCRAARSSSAWDLFHQRYQADLDLQEIDLLSKVASMGRVRSPSDFLYLLNSVRQVLGREVLDSGAKRGDGSSTSVEFSGSGDGPYFRLDERDASTTSIEADGLNSGAETLHHEALGKRDT